jgi:hypothetical protein
MLLQSKISLSYLSPTREKSKTKNNHMKNDDCDNETSVISVISIPEFENDGKIDPLTELKEKYLPSTIDDYRYQNANNQVKKS